MASKKFPQEQGLCGHPLQLLTPKDASSWLQNIPSSPTHRDDSAEVDVYNPTKNEWDKIPSMNQVNM